MERIRELAQCHSDDHVAAILNAEGRQTKMGLSWTQQRVGLIRLRHSIPTACPIMPHGHEPRGDGLVSVETVVAQVGASSSRIGSWCRDGFLVAEQLTPFGPRWIRLTDEDPARLVGTLAAQGYGQWRLREARRVFGLSQEELAQRLRDGRMIAYRAHVGDHWEWRVDPADQTQQEAPPQAVALQAESEEVQ